jgi:hypothetical protein
MASKAQADEDVWSGLSFMVDTEFEQAEAAAERLAQLTKQFYWHLVSQGGALKPEHAFYLTGIFLQNLMGYGKATQGKLPSQGEK